MRFYDQQVLRARDLRDDMAYEVERWRLHLRGLHNTWGIALGFDVTLSLRGTTVEIGPGLAYDCAGNPLLMARRAVLRLPRDLRRGAVLVIRNRDQATSAAHTCDLPLLLWREPDQVRLGVDVPLAAVMAGGSNVVLHLSIRRNARPARRPKIGWGTQDVMLTDTNLTFYGDVAQIRLLIDTSKAAFVQEPCYFAAMQLPMPVPVFELIDDAKQNGFTYQMLTRDIGWLLLAMRRLLAPDMGLPNDSIGMTDWIQEELAAGNSVKFAPVSWIGVEAVERE